MSQLTGQGARVITKSQMVDHMNDIAWQAHQGSVAAIIQVLNERLVMSGVRTRAIFADNVLHILCEAATVEQLEQSTLVANIQEILESIAPRNISKVNINSRIVQEQKLLWLEEINRNSENQLLWLHEITLSQPSRFQQLIQDLMAYTQLPKPTLPKAQYLLTNQDKQKDATKKLIIGSVSLCVLLLLAGLFDERLSNSIKNFIPLEISKPVKTAGEMISTISSSHNQKSREQFTIDTSDHKFADAVRLANQASAAGKTATTSTQWLELAARWQRASDLMSEVSPSHSRYQEAQIRTKLYREYSKAAEKEAEKMGSEK